MEDLTQQVAALTAMVASLQSQVAGLAPQAAPAVERAAREEALEDEVEDQGAAALLTLLDNTLQDSEPLAEDDRFRPYDAQEFALECAEALANPEPLDWNLLADEPEEDEAPHLEPEIASDDLIAQMVHRHRPLVRGIVAYNDRNPPDFIVEDDLWVHLKENPLPPAEDEPADRATPASALFDMSLLDDLIEEAAQAAPAKADADPLGGWDIAGAFASAATGEQLFEVDEAEASVLGEEPDPAALDQVPPIFAIRALALPWKLEEGSLVCLVAKPFDEEALAALEEQAGVRIIRQPHPLTRVVSGLRSAYAHSLEVEAREDLLLGAAPMPPGPLDRILGWIGLGRAA
jgi:hypothetical protein